MSRSVASKMVSRLTKIFNSETEFQKDYKLGKQLGQGAYSTVVLAVEVSNKREVAVKCVVKKKMTPEDEAALRLEVAILQELKHPGIIELIAYYEEPKHHYLVTELMSGGELFNRIVQKEFYAEGDAQKVVRVMAEVLAYCHERDIAHRDLKPENVLLKDSSDAAAIKIADFGFARQVKEGCLTACGTPGYVAPEVISGKVYGSQCDNWSVGVITYILLCGYPPFYAKNRNELFKQIRTAKYVFDSPYWDVVSPSAKDLISKLLVVDPDRRFTAKEILNHPWVKGEVASQQDLKANVKELMLFNAKRHLRAGVRAAVAAGRLNDLLKLMKSDSGKKA